MMGKKILAIAVFFTFTANASALSFFVPKTNNLNVQIEPQRKIHKAREVSSYLERRCADLSSQMADVQMTERAAMQRMSEVETQLENQFSNFEREFSRLQRNIENAYSDLEDLQKNYDGREDMYFNGMTAYWYSNLDGNILTDRLNVFIANANRVSNANISPVPIHIVSEKDRQHVDLEDVAILIEIKRVMTAYTRVISILELDLGMREFDQEEFNALNQELSELQNIVDTRNQMDRLGC